jgi:hypothetical protein
MHAVILIYKPRAKFPKLRHDGTAGTRREESKGRRGKERERERERGNHRGMRGMTADGGSCIEFEGSGAELVRTNDYN